jgi:PAS domain S-box-containing protein
MADSPMSAGMHEEGTRTARDIRDRVLTVDQLREREEQYRSVFESTSDGLIINDPEMGRVVHANPAVFRMHGYSYDEFVGLQATDFIHPDFHPVFVDFLTTIRTGAGGAAHRGEACPGHSGNSEHSTRRAE